MKRFIRILIGAWACLYISPLSAADYQAIWSSMERPSPDPAKIALVKDIAIKRDRLRITFIEGTIQYAQPVQGMIIAAAFHGRGTVQVIPPNPMEVQQAQLFLEDDKLEMPFTEAAFYGTDGMLENLANNLQFSNAGGDPKLGELMISRLKAGEDLGGEVLPRLFKGVLSGNHARTGFFLASLKTDKKGWITARYDALNLEELSVGRWVEVTGGWRFDTWLEFPTGNRNPMQVWRDPMIKVDFDIPSYQIDASVNDGAELHATARVNLKYRATGERALIFHLDSNLRVDAVKDSKGNALTFVQPREAKDRSNSYGEYIVVVLPAETQAGETERLEFHYGGKRVVRKVGNGNYFCESFGWYPSLRDSFATRSDFEISFKSPKKYTLVATGSKTAESTDGDLSITTWKSDIPQAVAGFAFGDYKEVKEKVGDVEVQIYANRNGDDTLQAIQNRANPTLPGQRQPEMALGTLTPAAMTKDMLAAVTNNIRLFEQYFGPFPYKKLAVTNIPFSYGQGWPSLLYLSVLTFLDSTQRNQLGIRDQTRISDFFRAHETSHQWWGHRVGWKSYHDQWLSEGFAQFSGNLYVQYNQNFNEYLNRLRSDKRELSGRDLKNRAYESLGPVWMGQRLASSDAGRAYSTVIYNKGGYILHMLRMMTWDTRAQQPDHLFIDMMKEFTSTYDNKAASTEDFKAIADKYMPRNAEFEPGGGLNWFFRQYVYGVGIPQYQFSHTAEPAGEGKWKISGTITRSGVPEPWFDVIPIYVQIGGKSGRLGTVATSQASTPFSFVVSLPGKPEKIVANLNEDILADFKQ